MTPLGASVAELHKSPAGARRPLDALFRPASVALVGASTDKNNVGRQILDNLLEFGYPGPVYAVNPRAESVAGLPAYPSLRAIEAPLDLAVLIVPRHAVLPVVEECVEKRVRGLVVITAGFRELDAEGARMEAELRRRARQAGIPLLGPNCMGLFNTEAGVRLDLTFSPVHPQPGGIAFLSQSGALGAEILTLAETERLGFSLFASLGNEAVVSHLDALEYAADDANTRVIALYLETFSDPERFLRVVSEVTHAKPVVCLKGGRTESGARAAGSHTGALATSARALEAVLRQSGALLVDSTSEFVAVARGLADLPLPRGRRVCLLTNAGGPAVVATDWLVRKGLELPPLTRAAQESLRTVATRQAVLGNPVDLTVEGKPEMYEHAARVLLNEPADMLVALFVEPPRVSGADVLAGLERAAAGSPKPVLAAFPAQEALRRQATPQHLTLFDFPEVAAVVAGALADYAEVRQRPRGDYLSFRVNRQRVARLLERARRMQRTVLDAEESLAALRAYGIPVVRSAFVRSAEELLPRARHLRFPLALKAVAPQILHKTEVGGVILNIATLAALKKAYNEMTRRLPLRGVLLQEMAPVERELIFGFRRDAQGIPMLLAGLGGLFVEALDAVAVRVLPVTDRDVEEMLEEMPGSRVLSAFRGLAPVARPRLVEVLLRLAQLAADFPAISDIDVNPFLVSARPADCRAVDARILLRGSTLSTGE
ncbi:MAG TPA: acetate--CoA ligase family protein [Candidatus Xenobia bacterium]|nr:acetate--CoA ligase family protein [Candidatus Xenobia bacterium]